MRYDQQHILISVRFKSVTTRGRHRITAHRPTPPLIQMLQLQEMYLINNLHSSPLFTFPILLTNSNFKEQKKGTNILHKTVFFFFTFIKNNHNITLI